MALLGPTEPPLPPMNGTGQVVGPRPVASTSSTAMLPNGTVTGHARAHTSIADLADVTEQVFGTPNAFPGPPPSHFFPSVSKQDRERLKQARIAREAASALASPSAQSASGTSQYAQSGRDGNPTVTGLPAEQSRSTLGPGADSGPDQRVQDRQDPSDFAANGLVDSFKRQRLTAAADPTSQAEADAILALQQAGVGAGGSGGTKRRFRDVDRANWDATSELVRTENGRDLALRGTGATSLQERRRPSPPTIADQSPMPTDREKTPTPGMLLTGAPIAAGANAGLDKGKQRSDSRSVDFALRRESTMTMSEASDGEDGTVMDDEDDDASIMTGMTGVSAGGNGSDTSGKEPAKKRSRTLTTPAQTAVLNALLAKTRFPSTETREEVGRQIGMSARRVQIWFQNRRQSQKRQREREAQEELAAARAARAIMSAQAQHMVGYPVRMHTAYDPAQGAYVQAAQYYPPLQPKPLQTEYVLASGRAPPAGYHLVQSRLGDDRLFAVPAGPQPQQVTIPIQSGDPRYPSTYVAAQRPSYEEEQYQRRMSLGGGGGPIEMPVHVLPAPRHAQPFPAMQQQQQQQQQIFPSKLYFPHVPRQNVPPAQRPGPAYAAQPPPAAVANQLPQPPPSSASSNGDVKLPPISTMFEREPQPSLPGARESKPSVMSPGEHAPMFSHSPFSPPPPAHATISGMQSRQPLPSPGVMPQQPQHARALFSPEPASSFERLRISGDPSRPAGGGYFGMPESSRAAYFSEQTSSDRMHAPRDILDMAVDAMSDHSSRALPPRHVLPPLRTVFSDTFAKGSTSGASEADQALTRPIRPPGATRSESSTSASGHRLPPLSSLAPTSPQREPALVSPPSNASRTTLSTAASFDFGRPPPGSYRAERYNLPGTTLVQSTSNSTISPQKNNGSAGESVSAEDEPDFWRDRGDSVGTGETSLASADAHGGPVPAK